MCKFTVGTAYTACPHGASIKIKGVRIPCGSWNCPECGKRKSIMLGTRVKAGLEGETVRFATFTTKGKRSLAGHLKTLKTAWNRLRLELNRKYHMTKFFWVLEFGHDKGRPHLHVLLNCYVPQRRLSTLAEHCGFGPIVDIRRVKQGGGFGYVYKYLQKDCGSTAGACALRITHSRRFGTSRNIPPIKREADGRICLAFVKDQIDQNFIDETCLSVANSIGHSATRTVMNGFYSEYTAVSNFDTDATRELLQWVHSKIITPRELLLAGGYVGYATAPHHVAAQLERLGLLDTVPF